MSIFQIQWIRSITATVHLDIGIKSQSSNSGPLHFSISMKTPSNSLDVVKLDSKRLRAIHTPKLKCQVWNRRGGARLFTSRLSLLSVVFALQCGGLLVTLPVPPPPPSPPLRAHLRHFRLTFHGLRDELRRQCYDHGREGRIGDA